METVHEIYSLGILGMRIYLSIQPIRRLTFCFRHTGAPSHAVSVIPEGAVYSGRGCPVSENSILAKQGRLEKVSLQISRIFEFNSSQSKIRAK